MKKFLITFFMLLFIESYADNMLMPLKEEMNKIGSLKITTTIIPEKFQKMWTNSAHARYMKNMVKDERSKNYKLYKKGDVFTWKTFTPKNYVPENPSGILVMPIEAEIEQLPENIQNAIDLSNIILVCPIVSRHRYYITELVFIAVDIVKARYKTNPDRLYYAALPDFRDHYAYLCKPDVFKGFINLYTNGIGYKKNEYTGKFLRDLEKTLKNYRFAFIGVNDFQIPGMVDHTEKFQIKDDWRSFHIGIKFKENNNEFEPNNVKVQDVFYKIAPTPLIESIQFLDEDIMNKGNNSFKLAEKALKENKINEAMNHYLDSHKNLNLKAWEKYKLLAKNLIDSEKTLKDLLRRNEFYQANLLALKNVKEYGAVHAAFSSTVVQECKNNKKIQNELKAAVYLLKIQNAIKSQKAEPDKIKKACEDVIKFAPDTKTAQKAQKILENLSDK